MDFWYDLTQQVFFSDMLPVNLVPLCYNIQCACPVLFKLHWKGVKFPNSPGKNKVVLLLLPHVPDSAPMAELVVGIRSCSSRG